MVHGCRQAGLVMLVKSRDGATLVHVASTLWWVFIDCRVNSEEGEATSNDVLMSGLAHLNGRYNGFDV